MALGTPTVTGIPTAQQIQQQAHAYAVQSVAAQVAAIHQAQQQAINAAAQRAAAIQQATLASAKYLQHLGLGNAAKADYANAVRNQTGIAQGFTGQLRTDALAAADAGQASLASIPGNTQTLTSHGDSLANALYGLTGAIPANTLQVAGLGAASSARALPAQTLGYGSQQAALARGQGATQAGSLADQIISARGQLPTIEGQYAGQLTNYANAAADNVRQQAALDSLIQQRQQPQTLTSGGGIYQVDSAGNLTTLKSAPPPGGGNGSTGGLTPNKWSDLTQKAGDEAKAFYRGVAPDKQYVAPRFDTAGKQLTPPHWIPVPGTGTPPVPYASAVAQLLAMGPNTGRWAKFVLRTVNGLYAPGEGGRPETVAQKRRSAAGGAAISQFMQPRPLFPVSPASAATPRSKGTKKSVLGPVAAYPATTFSAYGG